jgi:hypothetical protein
MSTLTNEEVVRAYIQATSSNDQSRLSELRHPDWYADWPQSGERVRGHANARAIDEAFPGGAPLAHAGRIVGSEDRWIVTPAYTVQRLVGNGDSWWGDGTITYADGSTWYLAIFLEVRDRLIHHEIVYFGAPFEAPAWRAPFVERIDLDE